jgi:hypothetical protein
MKQAVTVSLFAFICLSCILTGAVVGMVSVSGCLGACGIFNPERSAGGPILGAVLGLVLGIAISIGIGVFNRHLVVLAERFPPGNMVQVRRHRGSFRSAKPLEILGFSATGVELWIVQTKRRSGSYSWGEIGPFKVFHPTVWARTEARFYLEFSAAGDVVRLAVFAIPKVRDFFLDDIDLRDLIAKLDAWRPVSPRQ